jgi:hypothetical protein
MTHTHSLRYQAPWAGSAVRGMCGGTGAALQAAAWAVSSAAMLQQQLLPMKQIHVLLLR